MKIKSLAITGLIGLSAICLFPKIAKAQATTFECKKQGNIPTTFVTTTLGRTKELIRWTKTWSSVSPERRCQIVSQKLQQASNQGMLQSLVPAYKNGQGVICGNAKKGSSCDIVLFTVAPKEDPKKVLEDLGRVGAYVRNYLEQNTGIETTYFDFEAFLKD